MKTINTVLGTLLLFFSTTVDLYSANTIPSKVSNKNISIQGSLVDEKNKPLTNYKVFVLDFDDKLIASAELNYKGFFNIKTTTPGPYLLHFKKENSPISKKTFIYTEIEPHIRFTAKYIMQTIRPGVKDLKIDFENEALEKINLIWRDTQNIGASYKNSIMSYATIEDVKNHKIKDFSKTINLLEQKIKTEQNPTIKSALYIQYLSYEGIKSIIRDPNYTSYDENRIREIFNSKIDIAIVKDAYKFVNFNSQLWRIEPLALRAILRLSPDTYDTYKPYFTNLLESNKDPVIKSDLLLALCEFSAKENKENEFSFFYGKLMSNHLNSKAANKAKLRFGINSNIIEGKKAPKFNMKDLDNPNQIISNESMIGKVYLIDFWATWCGPCVKDIPNLNKAYKKYNSKGFDIISVSLDGKGTEDRIQKFREAKLKMPWINTLLNNGFNDVVAKDFQIFSIPTKILIDRSGKIIAYGNDLSGDDLLKKIKDSL